MDKEIIKHMGFTPAMHNEIYYDHLEKITEFLKAKCPIERKKAVSMLRGTMGISTRYVKDHLDTLCAWDIIRSHAGNYEWIFGIKIEDLKPEDIPDRNIGILEIKPCSLRNDEKMICSANSMHLRKTTVEQCNSCGSRQ